MLAMVNQALCFLEKVQWCMLFTLVQECRDVFPVDLKLSACRKFSYRTYSMKVKRLPRLLHSGC